MTSVLNILVNQVGIWPFIWFFAGSLLVIGDAEKEIPPLQQTTVGLIFIVLGILEVVIKLWF